MINQICEPPLYVHRSFFQYIYLVHYILSTIPGAGDKQWKKQNSELVERSFNWEDRQDTDKQVSVFIVSYLVTDILEKSKVN